MILNEKDRHTIINALFAYADVLRNDGLTSEQEIRQMRLLAADIETAESIIVP